MGIMSDSEFIEDGSHAFLIRRIRLAEEYERVHFVGHMDYAPGARPEHFRARQAEIYAELDAQTEFSVFIRDIKIKHFPPGLTDVDFVFDVPVESPIAPIVILIVIAAIVAGTAAIVYVAWRWWTVWVEKDKLYYCEQDDPMTTWQGWLNYVAHLKDAHPVKYEAIMENKSTDWWEALVPLGFGALAVIAIIAIAPALKKEKD